MQSKKAIWVVLILSVVILLVSLAFFLSRNASSLKLKDAADVAYRASMKYNALGDSSSEDDMRAALIDLSDAEASFAENSFQYSQMNFYQANVYHKLSDTDNENLCLEDIVTNAKHDNYLLPIAMYRLAVNADDRGDSEKALELYRTFWDKFGSNSPYSQSVIFSLFRLEYLSGNVESYSGYLKIMQEKYPSSALTRFAQELI